MNRFLRKTWWLWTVLILGIGIVFLNLRNLVEWQVQRQAKSSFGDSAEVELESFLPGLIQLRGIYLPKPLDPFVEETRMDAIDLHYSLGIRDGFWLDHVVFSKPEIRLNLDALLAYLEAEKEASEPKSSTQTLPVLPVRWVSIRDGAVQLEAYGERMGLGFGGDVEVAEGKVSGDFRIGTDEADFLGDIHVEFDLETQAIGTGQFDLFLNEGEFTNFIERLVEQGLGKELPYQRLDWDRAYLSGLVDGTKMEMSTTIELDGIQAKWDDSTPEVRFEQLFGNVLWQDKTWGFSLGGRLDPFLYEGFAVEGFAFRLNGNQAFGSLETESIEVSRDGFPSVVVAFAGEHRGLESYQFNLSFGKISGEQWRIEPFGIRLNYEKALEGEITPVGLIGRTTFWLEDFNFKSDDLNHLTFGGVLFDDLGMDFGRLGGHLELSTREFSFRWNVNAEDSKVLVTGNSAEISATFLFNARTLNTLKRWIAADQIRLTEGTLSGQVNGLLDPVDSSGKLSFNQVGGEAVSGSWIFGGMVGEFDFVLKGDQWRTEGVQTLKVKEVTLADWIISDIVGEFEIHSLDGLTVHSVTANAGDGKLGVKPFTYDLSGNSEQIQLVFEGIEASRLLEKFPNLDYQVNGPLDGVLSLRIESGELVVESFRSNLSKGRNGLVTMRNTASLEGMLSFGADQLNLKGRLMEALQKGIEVSSFKVELVSGGDDEVAVNLVFSGLIETPLIRLPLENFTIRNQFDRIELENLLREELGVPVKFN